tara:strand:+ start:500 stop:676 length:177 start_codon:yes stop_codon:yes gene_type:complete
LDFLDNARENHFDDLEKIEKFFGCTFGFDKMKLDGSEKKSLSLGWGGGLPGQVEILIG